MGKWLSVFTKGLLSLSPCSYTSESAVFFKLIQLSEMLTVRLGIYITMDTVFTHILQSLYDGGNLAFSVLTQIFSGKLREGQPSTRASHPKSQSLAIPND